MSTLLEEAVEHLKDAAVAYMKEAHDVLGADAVCDHEVNICWCFYHRAHLDLLRALRRVEHGDTIFMLQRMGHNLRVTVKPALGEPMTLPHLMHHSPDGFEWGYGGSGPADLARSITGWLLETDDPPPGVYQRVKECLVANVPTFGGVISGADVFDVIEDVEDGV
jgi:hypothetical protein